MPSKLSVLTAAEVMGATEAYVMSLIVDLKLPVHVEDGEAYLLESDVRELLGGSEGGGS